MAGPKMSAPVPRPTSSEKKAAEEASDSKKSGGGGGGNDGVSGARVFVLLAVSVGIWSSFAWWSVLQERLITRPYATPGGQQEKFRAPFFLNVVSYTACVGLAAVLFPIARYFNFGEPWKSTDLVATISSGFTLSLSTPCGYAAMRHLAYPIVLTAKMCKSIPAMAVGFFWYKQRYEALKYVGVLLLTFGVLGFSLFDEKNTTSSSSSAIPVAGSAVGLALCIVNLVFDGYTQSSQDAIINASKAGSLQMMIIANGAAALCALGLLLLSELFPSFFATTPLLNEILVPHELSTAMAFMERHPRAIGDLFDMAVLGAVGQVFIFAGISYFGTLTVMGLTVSRKIGSVLISIWLHDHKMTLSQYVCLVVVVLGIGLDSYQAVMSKKQKKS